MCTMPSVVRTYTSPGASTTARHGTPTIGQAATARAACKTSMRCADRLTTYSTVRRVRRRDRDVPVERPRFARIEGHVAGSRERSGRGVVAHPHRRAVEDRQARRRVAAPRHAREPGRGRSVTEADGLRDDTGRADTQKTSCLATRISPLGDSTRSTGANPVGVLRRELSRGLTVGGEGLQARPFVEDPDPAGRPDVHGVRPAEPAGREAQQRPLGALTGRRGRDAVLRLPGIADHAVERCPRDAIPYARRWRTDRAGC